MSLTIQQQLVVDFIARATAKAKTIIVRAPTVVEETHLLHAVAVGDLLDIGWSVIVIVPTAHGDYAAMPRASRTLRGL